MIIVKKQALQELQAAILNCFTRCCDVHGTPIIMETIDPDIVRGAALGALTTVAKMPIWPGDKMLAAEAGRPLIFVEHVAPRRAG